MLTVGCDELCPASGQKSSRERAGRVDAFTGRQGLEGGGEVRAVGENEIGIELQEGDQDEAPARHLGVREGQALGLQFDVAEQQQVDVEGAGAVPGGLEAAAALGLDRLAGVEQLFRPKFRTDADDGVEEVGLVEDLPHRLGQVGRGDGLDGDATPAKQLQGSAQVGGRVADVGSEPQVANPGTQLSASASSSSTARSWVTSTATSWIASGSGGSGLAARTRTDSQP